MIEVSIPVPTKKRGYHDLTVTLETSSGTSRRLTRQTSFAVLPPDTRRHRDTSPFGTYSFGGSHYTSNDPDQMGPLYVKMGLRYGMFNAPVEVRRKYGILKGNEPNITNGPAGYEKALAANPELPPTVLLFHETSISGKHIMRTPDLFHDRPAYKLNETEEAHFKKLWDQATKAGQAMRDKYPQVRIQFRQRHPADQGGVLSPQVPGRAVRFGRQ